MRQETVQTYVDEIKACVASWRNGELVDPPLQSELLTKALDELGEVANKGLVIVEDGDEIWIHSAKLWARALLVALHCRAVSGVPFIEPIEPSWSLDPDERPYEYTLDEAERGGH